MPSKFVTTAEEWEKETGLQLEPTISITPMTPKSLRAKSDKSDDPTGRDQTTVKIKPGSNKGD